MFERKVQPGDHVIDQGDDGDNFYVIDKYVFYFTSYFHVCLKMRPTCTCSFKNLVLFTMFSTSKLANLASKQT